MRVGNLIFGSTSMWCFHQSTNRTSDMDRANTSAYSLMSATTSSFCSVVRSVPIWTASIILLTRSSLKGSVARIDLFVPLSILKPSEPVAVLIVNIVSGVDPAPSLSTSAICSVQMDLSSSSLDRRCRSRWSDRRSLFSSSCPPDVRHNAAMIASLCLVLHFAASASVCLFLASLAVSSGLLSPYFAYLVSAPRLDDWICRTRVSSSLTMSSSLVAELCSFMSLPLWCVRFGAVLVGGGSGCSGGGRGGWASCVVDSSHAMQPRFS
ncbi:unnamed protein product [Mycena citricolor]|uniref:Uncharacterized protein n=1 Tax=Mycena citricolor TaxID=2018698 RepID=A0AAD2JYM7_9AGAR|nr:unnamed protein product [Mycena citricolor]